MALASRFPCLTLPFAIVGATGGWLSADFLSNPLINRLPRDLLWAPCVIAAGVAGGLGALLTRWATWTPSEYSFSDEVPIERRWTKHWLAHSVLVLLAGALTGGLVCGLCDTYTGPHIGAAIGLVCAVVFVPVCLAVLSAARRAERARLGSLVSASDRMAVWGILAASLSVATLEASLDWPALATKEVAWPLAAVLTLGVATILIFTLLVLDIFRLRKAKDASAIGLVSRDPSSLGASDREAPRLDLGLGDGVGARVSRSATAYRGTERTLWLVQGDVAEAVSALRRAVWRGGLSLFVIALVASAHLLAQGDSAQLVFDEERCEAWAFESCGRVAHAIEHKNPDRAMALYARACGATSLDSCISVAMMYLSDDGASVTDRNESAVNGRASFRRAKAMEYFGRACRLGDRRGCLGLAEEQ